MFILVTSLLICVAESFHSDDAAHAERQAAWAHAALDRVFFRHNSPERDDEWPWLQLPDGNAARRLQPGGCGANGVSATGSCGTSTSSCATDGTSAYTTRALTFDTTTGIFSGTITTNMCPHLALENTFKGVIKTVSNTPLCCKFTFPAAAYSSLPKAALLRGANGFTIRGGMNVYGPLDAGFFPSAAPPPPNICSNPGEGTTSFLGICPGGTDVDMCYFGLETRCGSAYAAVTGLLSDCGNHATPSHYHTMLKCDYDSTDSSTHSTLLAVMYDGRGLYGMWEGGGTKPLLDACNGHYGPVPAIVLTNDSTQHGDTSYPSASNVYHYHISSTAPFTIGCFGPVNSLAQAKALYPTCGSVSTTQCPGCGTATDVSTSTSALPGSVYSVCTGVGDTAYQLDCPVYRHQYLNGTEDVFNQITPTADCPVCSPNCNQRSVISTTVSTTPSPGVTPSPSQSPSTSPSCTPTAGGVGETPSPTPSPSITSTAGGGVDPGNSAASTVLTPSCRLESRSESFLRSPF